MEIREFSPKELSKGAFVAYYCGGTTVTVVLCLTVLGGTFLEWKGRLCARVVVCISCHPLSLFPMCVHLFSDVQGFDL